MGSGALVVVIALIFALSTLLHRDPVDARQPQSEFTAQDGDASTQSEPVEPAEMEPVATPEGKTAPELTPSPTGKPSLLPVIYRKKDEKKMVAITIDDCFQVDIVKDIIKLAEKHGADLTFFPKGNTIEKNADLWKTIYERGYEIENHSYLHTNVSKLDEEKLRYTIEESGNALNRALGVNYHMRLFRCPTGDGMRDPRLHAILKELGYQGVASWGLSGTRKASETIRLTQGGQILLFHSTKNDYARLQKVIPGLIQRGFKLVSINELYDKGPNEVTPLDTTEDAA